MSSQTFSQTHAPDAHSVRMRAAAWLQRRQFWNWSEQDQADLDNWLAESPTHMVAYLRVQSMWGRTERLAALRKSPTPATSAEPRRSGFLFARVAAALVLMTALGIGGMNYIVAARQTIWTTPVGGHRTVMLPDGSQIELNTDTILRVAGDRRQAWLDRGEAYFQITHDNAHPFVVTVAGHRVTDLGTKFLVRSGPSGLEVTLVAGKARLESTAPGQQERAAILMPGDIAVASAVSMSVSRNPLRKVMDELAWRQGLLNFDNATLGDVADELNRYNREKLVIADAKVARLRIDASIPTHGIQAFTRVARDFLGLRVEERGGEVVISR